MGQETRHFINESDIGSGEKSAAQRQLEEEQRMIGQQHTEDAEHTEHGSQGPERAHDEEGYTLRSGNHLARIATSLQDDGSYEAQVYVRLTREPDIAETYIPVGFYPTEQEAWKAAEDRARRALEEQEF